MRQLVQLQGKADEFDAANTDVVLVFREEQEGLDGLKKIKDKTKTTFILAVDLGAEQTKPYSDEKGKFKSYVIDKNGKLRNVYDGSLRNRPETDVLLETVQALNK